MDELFVSVLGDPFTHLQLWTGKGFAAISTVSVKLSRKQSSAKKQPKRDDEIKVFKNRDSNSRLCIRS